MIRKLLYLTGLSIFAVVCNHAAGWGFTAMFWWTDRYTQTVVPNFDQIGSLSYISLIILRTITVFSVPSFLFISGFFLAYSAKGNIKKINFRFLWSRIKFLIYPYILWSILFFLFYFLIGITHTPIGYIKLLLTGQVTPAYFYIPLLIQFYLISPFLIRCADKNPKLLLFIAGLIQLGVILYKYLNILGITHLGFNPFPNWLLINFAFFFPFGIVCFDNINFLKKTCEHFRWVIVLFSMICFSIIIIEWDYLYNNSELVHGATFFPSFPSILFSILFILLFFSFGKVKLPLSKCFDLLAKETFGIYLIHPLVHIFLAKSIYHFIPIILSTSILFVQILVLFSLLIPIFMGKIIDTSPVRPYRRFLLG